MSAERKYTLDYLIQSHPEGESTVPKKIREMFLDSLEIKTILSHQFNLGPYGNTRNAIAILSEFSSNHILREERREALRVLLESEDFGTLLEANYENNSILSHLDSVDSLFRQGRLGPIFDPQILHDYYAYFNRALKEIELIAENLPDTHYSDMATELLDDIRGSKTYPGIEAVLSDSKIDKNRYKEIFRHLKNWEHGLHKFAKASSYFFGYASGFKDLQRKKANIIFPDIQNRGGYRICDIRGGVNFMLYLGENKHKQKVPNFFYSDELEPVTIITGENMYGKTMAIKTVGVIRAFAQAGLPVIADSAELGIVDNIFANIGVSEDSLRAKSTYKARNEITHEMVKHATAKTLLILDEPTIGTYDLKAVLQGKAYVEQLARKGYEAWIATHRTELTELAEEFEGITNLQTEAIHGTPTFKLVPGVFVPQEENVKIDYTRERLEGEMRVNKLGRLKRLVDQGDVPDARLPQLMDYIERHS